MSDTLGILLTLIVCIVGAYASTKFSHRTRATGIPPPLSQTGEGWGGGSRRWRWESLSDREMEVAQLVAQGKRNSEIARDLSISLNTVRAHVKNIYGKLDVHSRVELTRAIRDLVD